MLILWLIALVAASPIQQVLNIGKAFNIVDQDDDFHPDIVNKTTLDSWISDQYNVSWINLLKNIGNSSYTQDENLYPGVIVASPSKIMPDYYYQWTRDSALTIRSLIHYLQDNSHDSPFYEEFQLLVEYYIWNNYHLQRLTTKSGDFVTGKTLGEPKFLVNNLPFDLNWGRPQSDGPGLRITSILSFIKLNLDSVTGLNSTFIFNEVIKPDIYYVINNWTNDSFDLWEEINSLHFFTSMVQFKGLLDAWNFISDNNIEIDNVFANEMSTAIANMRKFIQIYYVNDKVNYVLESPKLFPKRSGLDAAVLLGSIHTHDMLDNQLDDLVPFNVDNTYILNHLLYLINDMRARYPINHNLKFTFGEKPHGVGIGRYPEDIYDGYGTTEGNPWFISTATASEMILKYIYKLVNDKQDLIITKSNLEFFKLILNLGDNDLLIVKYDSDDFKNLVNRLLEFSDSFLIIIKNHVDAHGGISEQFNKYHGFMQGARDLTWSYSSLLNAFRWREKIKKLIM